MYVTEMLKSENFSNILSPLKIVLFLAAKSLVLLIVNLSIYEYFNFIVTFRYQGEMLAD